VVTLSVVHHFPFIAHFRVGSILTETLDRRVLTSQHDGFGMAHMPFATGDVHLSLSRILFSNTSTSSHNGITIVAPS